MPESRKFPPEGYQVTVLRKQDVLKCIDENIIDKEIALEIVRRCEIDATDFLKQGRWAGIPFLGNIRIPKIVQTFLAEDTQQLMAEAKENLDEHKYLLFRRQFATDAVKREDRERYYKYELSKFVGKNLKFFRKLAAKHGEKLARVKCFTLRNMTIVTEDNIYE
jgi:hypothetical protein